MDLESTLLGIQRKLQTNQFFTEAAVSQGIVLPILNALGWNVFDTNIVVPEFPIETGRIDFALCYPPNNPKILIEVKKVGKAENADEQLFKYAFHVGAPIVLLTDGRDWSFYFPSGSGNYTERRFYKLDLIERDRGESIYRLSRYLAFQGVPTSEYLRNAQHDYASTLQAREIRTKLPIAFKRLTEEKNETLISLLKEKVADLCGYQATEDDIIEFLLKFTLDTTDEPQQRSLKTPVERRDKIKLPSKDLTTFKESTLSESTVKYSIQWREKTISARTAIDLLRKFFDYATTEDPNFGPNFMKTEHGRTRRYMDLTPEKVYPERPDFAKDKTYRLKSGYYIGTNLSAATIKSVILLSLESNKMKEGQDFVLKFDK